MCLTKQLSTLVIIYLIYYLTISQNDFSKLLISAQKLHCKKKHLLMATPALKYDHDIIIIKYVESLKLFLYKEAAGR